MDKPVFDVLFDAFRYVDTNSISGTELEQADIDTALRIVIERYKFPDTVPITGDIASILRTVLVLYDINTAQRAFSETEVSSEDPLFGNDYLTKRAEEQTRLQSAFDWLARLPR